MNGNKVRGLGAEKMNQNTATSAVRNDYEATDRILNPTLLQRIESKEDDLTQRLEALRRLKKEVKGTGILDQINEFENRFNNIAIEYN